MSPSANDFVVHRSFRVPGLGLLVLPAAPAPAWLATTALHTALELELHRPSQPPLTLVATVEELAATDEQPTRALLLDADPGTLPANAWLVLKQIIVSELL
jgi:hypothetical protein